MLKLLAKREKLVRLAEDAAATPAEAALARDRIDLIDLRLAELHAAGVASEAVVQPPPPRPWGFMRVDLEETETYGFPTWGFAKKAAA